MVVHCNLGINTGNLGMITCNLGMITNNLGMSAGEIGQILGSYRLGVGNQQCHTHTDMLYRQAQSSFWASILDT